MALSPPPLARGAVARAAAGGGDEDVDLTANQQAPSVDDLRLAAAALADAVSPPDSGQHHKSADPSVAAALEEGRKTLKLLSVRCTARRSRAPPRR